MKKNIYSEKAPKPVGPYSQAVKAGAFLFVSGTLPIDPVTGEMINGEIEDKTKRILENIKIILNADNLELKHIVKMTIYLKDMSLFSRVNSVYKDYFVSNPPARSAVGVSELPKNSEIEMEAVAYYED
jgi:2-iminobutanoate/2-iminopropanoate deaminase